MKKSRLIIYGVYLFAVVLFALEVCLRFGLIESEVHMIDNKISEIGEGRRVLILGDSFSTDMEGSFAHLLREYLATKNCITVNLARDGAGPQDYLEMFERFGADVRPELVIVNTYVGNDITDTVSRMARTRGYKEIARRFLTRSYLGSLLLEVRAGMISRSRLENVDRFQTELRRDSPAVENPFLLELSWTHPDCFLTNLFLQTPGSAPAWEANQEAFMEIKRIADSMNALLLLNIFPDSVQINESHHGFFRDLGFKLEARVLSTSTPQDLLAQFCNLKQLMCLDLLPAFREHAEREFYRTNDIHWNADGNRFAFELVKKALEGFPAASP